MKYWKIAVLALSWGAFAQAPNLGTICLKDNWDLLVAYFDSATGPAVSIRDTLNNRFDTVYVRGTCDSITVFGKMGPLTFQLGNAKRPDSCNLSLDIYPPFDALLADTAVNICTPLPVERPLLSLRSGSTPSLFAQPSPAAPNTAIFFDLPKAGEVHMALYDIQGKVLKTLARGSRPAGLHRVSWNGTGDNGSALSKGVYVVRLNTLGKEVTHRLLLIR